nr:hypothetical protein [Tanacetum cinerariifolium]
MLVHIIVKNTRIGKRNFRLISYITSKESTLQLVYDVLRLTPFYKAFLVTADVPEIYMQEFWATATVHHNSIRFKMDNRKRIVNLEYFREMLHICPRLPGQTFDALPFKEEILAFFIFLGHSGEIRKLTDVNINKLHQPWRSFVAVINKCLSGKSTCYDSLRNKVNWYYVIDDQMFTTIKLVLRHQNTQQFGVMLPIELTNKDIKNSRAYKEYYAVASGAAPPKTKASVRKTESSSDTTITPPTAAGTRLLVSTKGKQPAKPSKAKRTGIIPRVLDVPTEESVEEISWKSSDEDDDDDVDEGSNDQDDDDNQDDGDQEEGDDDDDQDEGNDDDQDSNEEGEEFIHPKLSIHDEEETKDEESFDPIVKTPKNSDDEDELYRDVNINLEGRVVQMEDVHTTQEFEDTIVTLTSVDPDGQKQSSSVSSQFITSMLNPTPDAVIDSLFETTSQMDVPTPTTMASLTLSAPTLTPSTIPTISTVPQVPTPPTTAPSNLLQDLPNFGSLFGFDHRLKTLEANFFEFMQTNQFAGAVSSIPEIIQRYMDQWMNKAVKILIEKMEINKSIHRSEEQRNLYKALVEAYESDKIILDTYEDIVTLKRRHDDDADKDEEPSARSDRGSKRRREGKEPESTSAPKEKATRTTGKSTLS